MPGLKTVFVFPGQGSQWAGMGRKLMEEELVFKDALEACSEAIANEAGWSLVEELSSPSRLEQIEGVQPALFAMGVSLAVLWRSSRALSQALSWDTAKEKWRRRTSPVR